MTLKEKIRSIKNSSEVRLLLEYCQRNGCSVKFRKGESANGKFTPFKNGSSKIVLYVAEFSKIWEVVWTLAHEVRHLKHWVEGKYKNYYSTNPTFICGIRAEQDCNDWASEYLFISTGYVFTSNYPSSSVNIKRIP